MQCSWGRKNGSVICSRRWSADDAQKSQDLESSSARVSGATRLAPGLCRLLHAQRVTENKLGSPDLHSKGDDCSAAGAVSTFIALFFINSPACGQRLTATAARRLIDVLVPRGTTRAPSQQEIGSAGLGTDGSRPSGFHGEFQKPPPFRRYAVVAAPALCS
ncbi:uncharacterized protein K460DRAFT_156591 [Cucurbitaria berberidis CBS 394.84]|uniref:Uncharacterized protein n=1 Tax=Cucurbitaria berberidis CBS 394.84 TaxID=1168544 RepID=A0A9P4L785_9PLEO|nr:uncharacterized protein K460DRAFT_156591 [Cucurbitaria berberidis CBS 394.84]KAF1844054.1 hypothetical protein K460DRAFT_156591 [Cucurbitaria berberidis CBS 394.84]